MGTNCGEKSPPDTTNQCDISVEGKYEMQNFCSYAGPAGDGYRAEYCSMMSSGGEWVFDSRWENGCSYNDCQPYQDFGFGCCRGCCGIVGEGNICRRSKFTGDPVTCCFNDLDCAGADPKSNPPLCYSDGTGRQFTCSDGQNGQPNYRSLVSTDCQDVLLQYCTGTLPTDNPNSTAWLDRWTQNNAGPGSCSYALARNMFLLGGTGHCFNPPVPVPGICNIAPPAPIDAEGFFWGRRLVSAAMARYTEQGFAIGTLPGFPGYNPWQDFLYSNVCCPYPGLCQDGLDVVCANKNSQRISLNPAVAQWCGCHLPQNEYENYSVRYNIPPECTPMCNRSGTIPIVGINADPVTCRQNICLIDGVTVNLINSQVGGGINFDQLCGSNCSQSGCSCIVSNTTIDIANSTIGGNLVPVNEGCGSFTCSQTNPGITGPQIINVPCDGTGSFNPYAQYEAELAAAQAAAKKNAWLWTLIAVGTSLILIFFIIFFIHPNFYPSEGTVISTPKPINSQFLSSASISSSVDGSSIGFQPDLSLMNIDSDFLPATTFSSADSSSIGSHSFSRSTSSSSIDSSSIGKRTIGSSTGTTSSGLGSGELARQSDFSSINNGQSSGSFERQTYDFRSIES